MNNNALESVRNTQEQIPAGMDNFAAFAHNIDSVVLPVDENVAVADQTLEQQQRILAAGHNGGLGNNYISEAQKKEDALKSQKINDTVKSMATQELVSNMIENIDRKIDVIDQKIGGHQAHLAEIAVEEAELDVKQEALETEREELTETLDANTVDAHRQARQLMHAADTQATAVAAVTAAEANEEFAAKSGNPLEMMDAAQITAEAEAAAEQAGIILTQKREIYLEQVADNNRIKDDIDNIDSKLEDIADRRAELTGTKEEIEAKVAELEAEKVDLLKDKEHLTDIQQRMENGEEITRAEVHKGLSETGQQHENDTTIAQGIESKAFDKVWDDFLAEEEQRTEFVTAPAAEEQLVAQQRTEYVTTHAANDEVNDPNAIQSDVPMKGSFAAAASGEPAVQNVAPEVTNVVAKMDLNNANVAPSSPMAP